MIQCHRPFGSGEEDFSRFLPYMGMAAILVMWSGPFEQTFVPPSQWGSLWDLASIGLMVSEEKMFANVDIHTYIHKYGRQRPTYTISSPMSLNAQRGARWLSGRVSDSGARGPGFETYRRRVVSLSKTLYSPKVLVNYPGSDGSVPTWLKNCWLGR